MPTGYTAPVQDGDITEFADYAISCARAFGATILLRDSEQSLEATKRYLAEGAYLDTSDYYEKALQKAKDRLTTLQEMTDEQALVAAQQEADRIEESNLRFNAKAAETQKRYESMIAKVEQWTPPSAEHVEFKEFMLSQLRGSIDFDCKPYSQPIPVVDLSWRRQQIELARESIAREEKYIREQEERNEQRKRWVTQLLESLEQS